MLKLEGGLVVVALFVVAAILKVCELANEAAKLMEPKRVDDEEEDSE